MSVVVEPSKPTDLADVAAIYAHAVRHGTASFEEEPPTVEELGRRRDAVIAAGLPHLIARDADHVLGFAYAGPFRPRPAYRYTVEDSVYVAPDAWGRGAGSTLLAALVRAAAAAGSRQMVAVIGDPSTNTASLTLHARHGFRRVGCLAAVGFKHGRWLDVALMQRALGG